MNNIILTQYDIEFETIKIKGFDPQKIVKQLNYTNQSYCLCSYLETQLYSYDVAEDVLIEINKAINSQIFDSDGGGDGTYLEIGFPNSIFTSSGGTSKITETIPSLDLKEIIKYWIKYLKK